MKIRFEDKNDLAAVEAVNVSAFETPVEARLVNMLREQAQPVISLVADDNGEIVGHILFSAVVLDGHEGLKIAGLAPMAVVPGRQQQGIGSALVRAGLEECRKAGFGSVVVLGHPGYYPRFGFVQSNQFGIKSEYDVPPDVFMVLELVPGYLDEAEGIIRYHDAFRAAESSE